MTDTKTDSDQDMKVCHACASDIRAAAKVCKECGARQTNRFAGFVHFATVAAVVATVISIISGGVALLPLAYSQFVRDPEPRLVELVFDSRHPSERLFGTFGLFNSGNVDAFVTRLVVEPENDAFTEAGETEFKIYQPLPLGKGFNLKIGSETAQVKTAYKRHWVPIDQHAFPFVKAMLEEKGASVEDCIVLFPFNSRLGLGPPEDQEFRNKEATTTLKGMLFYVDAARPTEELSTEVEGLYIEAATFLHARCAIGLGGKGLVEGRIEFRQQQ